MNKAHFIALADYNIWANNIVMQWLDQISDDQIKQEIPSSFSSIFRTALHIASAQKVWIDYWNKLPQPAFLSVGFNGSYQELKEIWAASSGGMKAFIESYPEEDFTLPISFRWPSGAAGSMAFFQTVTHVINHSTYHRGQIVNMLRQVGFTNLSSTDLATWYRVTR